VDGAVEAPPAPYRLIADQGTRCLVIRAGSAGEAFEMTRVLRREGWEVSVESMGTAA
jgi:hypothetical protein